VYIKNLGDVDTAVLQEMMTKAVAAKR
jgi:hypothetical protein